MDLLTFLVDDPVSMSEVGTYIHVYIFFTG